MGSDTVWSQYWGWYGSEKRGAERWSILTLWKLPLWEAIPRLRAMTIPCPKRAHLILQNNWIVLVSSGNREWAIVIQCINTTGWVLDLMIIFEGKLHIST